MHYGYNHCCLFIKKIVYGKWEAAHYRTPDIPIDNRIDVWIIFKLTEGR